MRAAVDRRAALAAAAIAYFCACTCGPALAQEPAAAETPDAPVAPAPVQGGANCGGMPTGSSAIAAVTSFFGAKSQSLLSRMRAGDYCNSTQAIGNDRDVDNQRVAYKPGLVHLPEFTDYANGLLEKLKAEVPLKNIPGSVFVLAKKEVGAHATADGNIYISLGWVNTLTSETALIGLLAHELGHVVLGHHESDVFTSIQKQFQLLAAGVGTMRRTMENYERTGVAQGTLSGRDMQQLKRVQWIIEISDKLIHPAWNRRQEMEADRFAIDLTEKLGHPYASSVKRFLEHIGDQETDHNTQAEANKAEVQQVAQIDLGTQLANDLNRLLQPLLSKHDDAGARLAAAQAYHSATYPKPATGPEEPGEFLNVKNAPAVEQVLQGYEQAFKADELLSRGQAKEALVEAQQAAGQRGPVSAHAYPLLTLSRALRLSGQARQADGALARSMDAPERNFAAYLEHAEQLVRTGRRTEATQVIEGSIETFSHAPRLYPELITFHTRQGAKDRAQQLLSECFVKVPGIRESCAAAAKGP